MIMNILQPNTEVLQQQHAAEAEVWQKSAEHAIGLMADYPKTQERLEHRFDATRFCRGVGRRALGAAMSHGSPNEISVLTTLSDEDFTDINPSTRNRSHFIPGAGFHYNERRNTGVISLPPSSGVELLDRGLVITHALTHADFALRGLRADDYKLGKSEISYHIAEELQAYHMTRDLLNKETDGDFIHALYQEIQKYSEPFGEQTSGTRHGFEDIHIEAAAAKRAMNVSRIALVTSQVLALEVLVTRGVTPPQRLEQLLGREAL
jgi:hypothetical protein